MKFSALPALLMATTFGLAGAARAQEAQPEAHIDTVTVQSQKQKDADPAPERHFSQSVLQPSAVDDHQYALWKIAICPRVIGLDPAMAVFIERRIREVATQAGAPVDRADSCKADIGIIFTIHPQELLDAIGHKQPELIYSHNLNQAVMAQPIQSWYAILGRNWDGFVGLDAECGYHGLPLPPFCGVPGPSFNDRLRLGLSPEIGAATVLVDIKAVNGMSLGTLADYFALLVLTQARAGDECRPAPSIANLLTKNCDAAVKTQALSEMDTALLSGLYHSSGNVDQVQRQRLISGMKKSLATQRGQ